MGDYEEPLINGYTLHRTDPETRVITGVKNGQSSNMHVGKYPVEDYLIVDHLIYTASWSSRRNFKYGEENDRTCLYFVIDTLKHSISEYTLNKKRVSCQK